MIHKVAYAGTPKMDPALFGHHDDGSALPGSIAANLHFLDQRGVPFVPDVPHQLNWMQERVEPGRGYLHLGREAGGGAAASLNSRRADMILIGI